MSMTKALQRTDPVHQYDCRAETSTRYMIITRLRPVQSLSDWHRLFNFQDSLTQVTIFVFEIIVT